MEKFSVFRSSLLHAKPSENSARCFLARGPFGTKLMGIAQQLCHLSESCPGFPVKNKKGKNEKDC